MTIKKLIKENKEAGEDFEFYPSTKKMIQVVADDIKSSCNRLRSGNVEVLDVGCGNGNALNLLQDCLNNKIDEYGNPLNNNIYIKKFGIEKSKTLIKNLSEDVIIVGCDFETNTLIDKKMNFIFSNPPYSEYEKWAAKLIKESNCTNLYLVIPQRWKESEKIANAIKKRCGDNKYVNVLGSFDFLDSEYRKARAKIDILKINLSIQDSPFNIWFDEHFKIKTEDIKFTEKENKPKTGDIVTGKNLIERLVGLYENELSILFKNYKNLQEIDASLLDELGVDKLIIRDGLQKKITGLKDKYWHELFNNLDKITDRLTTKYRKIILNKLLNTVSIDFNSDNLYSVVLWVIKNSNIYQDEQLIDTYKTMTEPENINLYKSNKHFVCDKWRYNFKEEISKYRLEYRLVFKCSMEPRQWHSDNKNGVSQYGFDFVNDIFTIAKTLGVKLNGSDLKTRQWSMGKQNVFLDDDGEVFAELRPYKNGNLHAKFSQSFILMLNIEAGKLNGWLKDPEHAAEEMEIENGVVEKYFNLHKKIDLENPQKLIELITN